MARRWLLPRRGSADSPAAESRPSPACRQPLRPRRQRNPDRTQRSHHAPVPYRAASAAARRPASGSVSGWACPSDVPGAKRESGARHGAERIQSWVSVSRMRVSSMTRPSSSGTLKSTRMKTAAVVQWQITNRKLATWLVLRNVAPAPCRLSCKGGHHVSRMTRLPPGVNGVPAYWFTGPLRAHVVDQVAYAAGVSPLVVVPGDHLHAIAADHQRHSARRRSRRRDRP